MYLEKPFQTWIFITAQSMLSVVVGSYYEVFTLMHDHMTLVDTIVVM